MHERVKTRDQWAAENLLHLLSLRPVETELLKRKGTEMLPCLGSERVFRVSKIQGYLTVIQQQGGKVKKLKFILCDKSMESIQMVIS